MEAANGTVTEAAGAVSSASDEVTGTVERTAGNATDTVEQTASVGTTSAEEVLGTHATAGTPGSVADDGSTGGLPADADVPPAASDRPDLLGNVPARVLDPFIHVWPAVALTVEASLGHFVGHWPRSVLTLLEENGRGSLRGDVGALPSSTPAPDPSDQPAFSRIPSPALAPFDRIASGGALMAVVFFVVLATATLTILGLVRRELGLPMLRRGSRFQWWR